MTPRSKKVKKSNRYELWQDGMRVVVVEATNNKEAKREIAHYAMMYGQDGPVKILRKP